MTPLRRALYFVPVFGTVLILVLIAEMNEWLIFIGSMMAVPILGLLFAIAAIPALLAIRDYLKRK